jgi:hypothetical protein
MSAQIAYPITGKIQVAPDGMQLKERGSLGAGGTMTSNSPEKTEVK